MPTCLLPRLPSCLLCRAIRFRSVQSLRCLPAVCRQCIVRMVHGFPRILAAGDAATPPRRRASKLKKSWASRACVAEVVSQSTSSSGASTPAASDSETPRPKRRRVRGKQSAHAAWQKPLALPEQPRVVLSPTPARSESQDVQVVVPFVQSMEVWFASRGTLTGLYVRNGFQKVVRAR